MAGAGVGVGMLRARRRDVSVKPNRKLDRKSSRGMIYENEELRLRTININAEVEQELIPRNFVEACFLDVTRKPDGPCELQKPSKRLIVKKSKRPKKKRTESQQRIPQGPTKPQKPLLRLENLTEKLPSAGTTKKPLKPPQEDPLRRPLRRKYTMRPGHRERSRRHVTTESLPRS
ncbi:hypothetical protein WH47_04676 [Habropoda laboriosa]|uniref:Uncharacterized protein n=1 Tax=Habropoda laboriosa TaxID=597456 RepID=A0A0L7R2T5_9HYME|nr:hypothetical protein WH47_04676 [Habropoda laboriosa]